MPVLELTQPVSGRRAQNNNNSKQSIEEIDADKILWDKKKQM